MTPSAHTANKENPNGKPMGVSVAEQDCRPVSRRYLQHEHESDETDSGTAKLNLSCRDLSSYSALHNHPACFHR